MATPSFTLKEEKKEMVQNNEHEKERSIVLLTEDELMAFEAQVDYSMVVSPGFIKMFYGVDGKMKDVTNVLVPVIGEVKGKVLCSTLLKVLSNINTVCDDLVPGVAKKLVVFVSDSTVDPESVISFSFSEFGSALRLPIRITRFKPLGSKQHVLPDDIVSFESKREEQLLKQQLNYLCVYKPSSKTPKIRIGSVNDGGYVIADGHMYDILLSCGISNDVTFEECFVAHYLVQHKRLLPIYAYDGTIKELPKTVPGMKWFKTNIGPFETASTTNLHTIIGQHNDVFLKMDIEAHEFRWLQTLTRDLMLRLKQIVIEFHYPYSYHPVHDSGLSVTDKLAILERLTETHVLIHLHANNCGTTQMFHGVFVPGVFECTYIRRDYHDNKLELSTDDIPNKLLDTPNTDIGPDIVLNHYPFRSATPPSKAFEVKTTPLV